MSLVIIDHEDSFTCNIVELLRKTGIEPAVVSIDNIHLSELDIFDTFILSPGPGIPNSYHKTKRLLDLYQTQKKILGICLGHQIIAEFFGAVTVNLKQVVHGQGKPVITDTKALLFNGTASVIQAGLYHSWIVSKEKFPESLNIIAQTKQGEIMAIAHNKFPIFGVQFHPESYISEYGLQIIQNFLNA